MKTSNTIRSLIAAALCVGCGVEPGSESFATAKYSKESLLGNYILSVNSCVKGQFDSSKASEFLSENRKLTELSKDGLKVTVTITDNTFTTTAPSTFYGAHNKTCLVTEVASLSFPSNQTVFLRLSSRTCSRTCSTADCKEEKHITSEPLRTFEVDAQQSKLRLIENSTKGVCISDNIPYPAQTEYTKQ